MSVGGVLGGMFNALLAPLVFNRHVEYMLVLALSCFLRPPTHFLARLFRRDKEPEPVKLEDYFLDVGYAVCLGLFTFAMIKISLAKNLWGDHDSFHDYLYKSFFDWSIFGSPKGGMRAHAVRVWSFAGWVSVSLVAGLPLVVCLAFSGRPLRFGLCAFAFYLTNALYAMATERAVFRADGKIEREGVIYVHRSFYGTQRVRVNKDDEGNEYQTLIHGGIDHGRQFRDPERRNLPITYFHPKGPIGQVFTLFSEQKEAPPYGVIGLGIGTLAAYSRPGQHVVFYEIDPAVKRLSLPPEGEERYFHYLHDAIAKRRAKVEVVLGDGRLKLKEAPAGYYHILVIDAFSSDAIPIHLLTREALDLYLSKLAPEGILIFNTTNRYVNLPPVLGDLAHERGLKCYYREDYSRGVTAKFSSDWVMMFRPVVERKAIAAKAAQLFGVAPTGGGLVAVPWAALPQGVVADCPAILQNLDWTDWEICPRRKARVWEDDYSNLLSALIW
jgi:hypothetical protein